MKNFLKVIYCISPIFFSANIHANVSISGEIKGIDITWSDAKMDSSGNVKASSWFPSSYLSMPTSQIFNAFIEIPTTTSKIKFSSSTDTVEVDSSGLGIEFELSNSYVDNTVPSSSKCSDDSLSGNSLLLYSDKSCKSVHEIKFNNIIAPFRFFRPIIDLKNIANNFQSAKVSKGDYVALVPITFGFNYVQSSSGVPTYIIFNDILEINIKYTPAILTSVELSGSNELEIKYDTIKHTATGMSKFSVLASGVFNPGLKITFSSDGKKDEFLLYDKASRTSIPYNISCRMCTIQDPVVDGSPVGMGETYINIIGNLISFSFYTYFKDISVNDVESGIYKDNVLVLIEVDI
ncbi:TPA: hypothetical protein ACX6MG_003440 [Photobacterium damselae]